ncbi:MAG: hypothetical protein ACRDRN_16825, partial [Sciscionella sp.]
PELYALATHHGENTLSAQIWRLEQYKSGQVITQWTALHFLIGGVIVVLLLWLIGHFTFGIWR